jgi:hypothetical protein
MGQGGLSEAKKSAAAKLDAIKSDIKKVIGE